MREEYRMMEWRKSEDGRNRESREDALVRRTTCVLLAGLSLAGPGLGWASYSVHLQRYCN